MSGPLGPFFIWLGLHLRSVGLCCRTDDQANSNISSMQPKKFQL